MPIYLKLETVKGESTAKGHEGWIELDSFSWGGVNKMPSDPNKPDKKDTSGEVKCTKQLDSTSVRLRQLALDGKPQRATIDFSDVRGKIYVQFQLKETLIAGHQISGSSGANGIIEQITLSYGSILTVRFDVAGPDVAPMMQDLWLVPSP